MMKKAFVHAWYRPGNSAGFDWFHEEDHAKIAYAQDVKGAIENPARQAEAYCCYLFDVSVPVGLSDNEVTDLIDGQLDDLSAAAVKFWPQNAKELSAAANVGKKVFVHACYTLGGREAFAWYDEESAAKSAYAQGVKEVVEDPSHKGGTFCCFFFELAVPSWFRDRENRLCDVIGCQLSSLCAEATTFYPKNAKELIAEFETAE
jgi:hypothetical protein